MTDGWAPWMMLTVTFKKNTAHCNHWVVTVRSPRKSCAGLEDRLLVDERRGHRVELELRGDVGSNLGIKVVRGLLGDDASYLRDLNFATLLIAELQRRLGLSR